ncbi:MAG: TlpA disulfide reductase family protein [Bacteroidales bacterium]|nr:TlpA disulfide reductase family protein [Bacteroidales bacterium]
MNKFTELCFLILLVLVMPACKQNGPENSAGDFHGGTTSIKGLLQAGAGESVVLEEMGAREFIPLDTVRCDNEGHFLISYLQDQQAFYILRFGSAGYITLLTVPGESIEFAGQLNNKDSYTVSGSPGSELLQTLAAEHKKALEALGDIARKNRELVSSPDYVELKQDLDLKFDSITSAFKDYSLSFIHENAASPATLIALYNLYGQGLPVFDPGRDFQVYLFVDSAMMANHSKLEAVRLLHAQVEEVKLMKDGDHQASVLKKGKIAPDFVSSRPDGTGMTLKSLRGNYVLLGFWASWSMLCREENATLVKAYEQFGDKNFRILQVSLDDNKEAWNGAIEEDGLVWDHVSDLKRWETPLVELYGVDRIPFQVIVDPAGKIVETDLYGEQLLMKLELLLNN